MTIVLGLTGGIASGKSTVSCIFASLGVPIIDADVGARLVVAPGSTGLQDIAHQFGAAVLSADGSLNRDALGRIVFARPELRKKLEGIIHPRVYEWMQTSLNDYKAKNPHLVILDIPLLFEVSARMYLFDHTVVVWVPPDVQLTRLMSRNHLSREEALLRIRAQMPLEQKRTMADFVIDNSGTLAETSNQVHNLWSHLMQM